MVQRKFARRTPCLEQLSFSMLVRIPMPPEIEEEKPMPLAEVAQLWPHLRVMRTKTTLKQVMDPEGAFSEPLWPLAGLRSFESYFHNEYAEDCIVFCGYCQFVGNQRESGMDSEMWQYPTLERYWVEDMYLNRHVKPCLAQSLAKGALSEVGLKLRSEADISDAVTPGGEYLQDVAWMAGEASVRTLGLFGLDMTGQHGGDWGRTRARIDAVVKFVESFPNLNTLVLSKAAGADQVPLATVAEHIMSSKRVERLFFDGCSGIVRDKLIAMAKEKDVVIEFDSRIIRPGWPLNMGPAARRRSEEVE